MKRFRCIIFLVVMMCFSSQIFAQAIHLPGYFGKLFDTKKADQFFQKSLNQSRSGDAAKLMSLRAYLGANNAIIEKKMDTEVIKYQKELIDNLILSATTSRDIANNLSYQDNYYGWISKTKNKSEYKETVLYEGYSFFYVAQFLYYLKKDGWITLSDSNYDWWRSVVWFIQQNLWTKWYNRSYETYKNHYRYFLRSRTHMASHWAGIAMYLKNMTTDPDIKTECEKVQDEYDLLLKRNFKPNPVYPSAYVWNSTYDNVTGTDAVATRPSVVQDVSHGNHVVAYVVAAYEMGDSNWTRQNIQKLCNTVKEVIYNPATNTFSDNVDGTPDPSRPGWGNFVADGWVKLSQYDQEVKEIFEKFGSNLKILHKYGEELQFKANLEATELVNG